MKKTLKSAVVFLIVIAVAFALPACKNNNGGDKPFDDISEVNKNSKSSIVVGFKED